MADRDLLVGYDSSDDACVYRVTGDTAVIQTVDPANPVLNLAAAARSPRQTPSATYTPWAACPGWP